MSPDTFDAFDALRADFRDKVAAWAKAYPELRESLERLRKEKGYDDYPLETPIVYNTALDHIGPESEIKLILVGDNPGKNEQRAERKSYLIGQSGKLAESFFRIKGRDLGIDFRAATIILNKTPVHTPKTSELKSLKKDLPKLIAESQEYMAGLIVSLHKLFKVPLWIVGYAELGSRGVFAEFTQCLASLYRAPGNEWLADSVRVYRHFSMNQFSVDLSRAMSGDKKLVDALDELGAGYRMRHLGF